MTDQDKLGLDAAYALKTPEDSKRLYADWAKSYDSDFAVNHDYLLPKVVADLYAEQGGPAPVLDVGAGTGLCAAALAGHGIGPIDATDISQEMLDVAATKGIYRTLFTGDLTATLPVPDKTYAGIISSGTFTTGHVGPEAFDELLRITAPGGLLAISINKKHFASAGFEAKLAALSDRISDLALPERAFYGPNTTGPHKNDTGYIALFRRVRD
ncbi:class I SAM-dependent DNA methyltransferase [Shimia aestuarii]|uniref:class I SAM-dependent DNA methyltransferase n=1 Tax=Shimia aestuarii TaxID=254406 RepID=UPI001FB2DEA1|nr:class I SAM-dependent methyltransferase [Shimia aestuarii]